MLEQNAYKSTTYASKHKKNDTLLFNIAAPIFILFKRNQ